MTTPAGPKLIQSVQRAIDILNCFNNTKPDISINEISARTGLNINTARGLINTMVANNLLILDHTTNMYHLGSFFLGKAGIIQAQIRSYIIMCKPLMNALAEKYHITASLQIVNQDEIVTIYCAYPVSSSYYITLSEYTPLPEYVTSSGKLLLAHTLLPARPDYLDSIDFVPYTPYSIKNKEELRQQLDAIFIKGYSTEQQEFNLDVGSIAVPIFNLNSELIGTVSVTVFASAMQRLERDLVHDLQQIAASVGSTLGRG